MLRFVRRTATAAAVLGLFAGSLSGTTPAAAGPADQEQTGTVRVMPLGDSITYGVGSPTRDSYRTDLYRELTAAGADVDFVGSQQSGSGPDRDNEGHPGWKIAQIADRIDGWLAEYEPDVILLHLGTNDMFAGNPDASAELAGLLDRIHEDRPSAQVFVAKLIGLGATARTGGQASRTAAFNESVEEMVAGRDSSFHLVDQTRVQGIDLVDRVHPNDFGYARMAANWYRALEPVLNTEGTDWPVVDDPARADAAVRCLGTAVTLPAYAKGCRRWYHRKAPGAMVSRVWQLPVRAVRRYQVLEAGQVVVKTRRTVRWFTAA